MRSSLIGILLFLPAVGAASAPQEPSRSYVLRGHVTDAATNARLPLANVFLAGTTRGTSADSLGRYTLAGVPRGTFDIVASLVGYTVVAEKVRFSNADTVRLDFRLDARVIQVEEVQATGTRKEEWRDDLAVFRDQFLGTDQAAAECTLLNPEVIDFDRSGGFGVLTARSDSMLLIDNRALGYRLQVLLNEFRWEREGGALLARQYVLFTPLGPENDAAALRWEMNRAGIFRGSKAHFLQSLFAGTSTQQEFTVYSGTPQELSQGRGLYQPPDVPEFMQHVGTDLAKLSFPGYVRVDYRAGGVAWSSIITLQWGDVYFDANGAVMDPKYITVLDKSAWARERIARLLPIDYRLPVPTTR